MFRTIVALALTMSAPAIASEMTYAPDPGHTEVRFLWDHAGVSIQAGEWSKVEGSVTLDPDNIGAAKVEITIDPNSLSTGVEGLDKHMKSPDMFDVAKHDTITFVSTGIEQTGDNTAKVTGDLTIKGITKPLVLDVEVVHLGEHPVGQYIDYYKGQWLGVKATGKLTRSEWDVGYGTPLTGDEITLEISSEMKAK